MNPENKGTSLILVHTKKGNVLLKELKDIQIQECDLDKAIKGNPFILKHLPANKNREKFFNELDINNLNTIVEKYIKVSIVRKVLRKSKSLVKKVLKNKRSRFDYESASFI